MIPFQQGFWISRLDRTINITLTYPRGLSAGLGLDRIVPPKTQGLKIKIPVETLGGYLLYNLACVHPVDKN